jgi:hypothetical protein
VLAAIVSGLELKSARSNGTGRIFSDAVTEPIPIALGRSRTVKLFVVHDKTSRPLAYIHFEDKSGSAIDDKSAHTRWHCASQ